MRFILALLAVTVVPLIALTIAVMPYLAEADITDPILITQLARECLFADTTHPDLFELCQTMVYHHWLGLAALITLVGGLLLLLVPAIIARIAGRNRTLLAALFAPTAFVSLFVMALLMVAQALLLMGALTLIQIYYFNVIFYYVVIAGFVVTAFLGVALFSSLFSMFKQGQINAFGIAISPETSSGIRQVVDEIASTLKTKSPDNIVLGLEPTFYATTAPVSTFSTDKPLKGETLYLSLPLMRMLSRDEARAIIGHELGHFSGKDVVYSKRFAPAYRGLGNAINNLSQEQHAGLQLASMPSLLLINYIIALFEPSEKRISRERELRADQIGASVTSPEALASSLVKLGAMAHIWQTEEQDMVLRAVHGRFSRNLSRNFVDRGRHDTNLEDMAEIAASSLEAEMEHPTDTHPTTRLRLEQLGIDPAPLVEPNRFKASLFPTDSLSTLIPDLEGLEEDISESYQALVIKYHGMDQSDEAKFAAIFAEILSAILAKMVVADGIVDDAEIETAQRRAAEYDSMFDATSFREFCRHPEHIRPVAELIETGNMILTIDGATKLRALIREIALADGHIDASEQALIDQLDRELSGNPDPDAQSKTEFEALAKTEKADSRNRRRSRR